jgi:hypothetical protein
MRCLSSTQICTGASNQAVGERGSHPNADTRVMHPGIRLDGAGVSLLRLAEAQHRFRQ